MAEVQRRPTRAEIQAARERGEKWCRSCEVFQPSSDFSIDRSRSDGLRYDCRESDAVKGRIRYADAVGESYRPWLRGEAAEAARQQVSQLACDTPLPDFITRTDAKTAGLTYYFDGRPCPKGHLSKKSVASYGCEECHKIVAKRWEAKGPPHPARLAALAAAEKTFRGEPCPNGHGGLRITKTGRCALCPRIRVARWKVTHPEYDATGKTRERRRKDPTKHRAASLKWARANKVIVKAALLRWQKENPERLALIRRAGSSRRRTRQLENGGAFNADDIQRLFDEQDGHCACCGCVPERLEIDHIMPVFLGGGSDPSNLQLLCFGCNRSKGRLHPDEWRRRLRLGIIVPKLPALL